MSTHTPGPWHIEVYNDGKNMDIQDAQGNGVLTKENAAFIVRACNSHEAMLGALKLAVTMHPHNVTFQDAIRLAEGRP